MSTINTIPRGLQEFLGNTSQGKNPSNLVPDVRPSLEQFPFLAVDKTRGQSTAFTITSPNSASGFVIPAGEIWVPISLGARVAGLATGDIIKLALQTWDLAGARTIIATGPSEICGVSGASEGFNLGFTWPRPVAYPSGWAFAASAQDLQIAAPSETMTVTIQYVLLRA